MRWRRGRSRPRRSSDPAASGGRGSASDPRHERGVRNLTLANQLTLLRIILVPAFVLLVVYGHLGAALITFLVAGITDALDGLIARLASQRTSLWAWLDPMADKLLL